jgi:general secretion pathway protein N
MQRSQKMLLFAAALGVILGVAIWSCPADVAYAWYGKRLQPVTLVDLSGDIWNGHAGGTRVLGREIGMLDWHLRALPMLLGKLVAQTDLSGPDGNARGLLSQSADQTLDVSDATVSLPAAAIEPVLGVAGLHLRGQVDIALAHARLRNAWIEAAEGSATWRGAVVAGSTQARLGDLRVDFTTAPDGVISCTVRDLGGPMSANGNCEIRAGVYTAEIRLTVREGDAHALDALQYLGQRQADGSMLLKIHGSLLKWM